MTAKIQEYGVMICDYTGDELESPPLPEFFCMHYKQQHNPRDFRLGTQETIIDVDKLKELDRLWNLKQFQDLARKPLILSWRSIIYSNGMGLIIITFKTKEPLPAQIHRKLSLFYLNFPVISTTRLDYLFETKWEGDVPAHITCGIKVGYCSSTRFKQIEPRQVQIRKCPSLFSWGKSTRFYFIGPS